MARYYGTQNIFGDQFDVKAESLSEDFGLKFSITKKDIWTAFWDRLDGPPEVSATIVGQYFTYFSYEGTEVVGIPLWRLKGELYNPWDYDEDDFDTDDFFIFDLDIPGKAKIQSIPENKRENPVVKTAVTGRTIQESSMEYVISRMKSEGAVAYNPDKPICGAWKSYSSNNDYEEWIIYICQDGTFFCYPILFYPTSYTPEVEQNLVQTNMGFEGQWEHENDYLYLHYQLNDDLLYQDEQMGRRDIAWKIAWEEDNNMFSSESVSSVAGISTQDLHYNLYRVLF